MLTSSVPEVVVATAPETALTLPELAPVTVAVTVMVEPETTGLSNASSTRRAGATPKPALTAKSFRRDAG